MEAARAGSIAMLAEEDLDPARWRRPSGDGSCPEWDSAGRNPTGRPSSAEFCGLTAPVDRDKSTTGE
jgi:hypothetical protein